MATDGRGGRAVLRAFCSSVTRKTVPWKLTTKCSPMAIVTRQEVGQSYNVDEVLHVSVRRGQPMTGKGAENGVGG